MLSIRLSKIGKKNAPSYRIVVANKRSGRDGTAIDVLGFYNPLQKEKIKIDNNKINKWVGLGARPTEAVSKILKNEYKFVKYFGSVSKKS